jgi:AcrR family transcriptional regulator
VRDNLSTAPSVRRLRGGLYGHSVPRLWQDTVEAHRGAVRDAALDATADLVAKHGIGTVSMSRIAQRAGIGRATLYKYFPDVDAVLEAWHQRQVLAHLQAVSQASSTAGSPLDRLRAVLAAYAAAVQQQLGGDPGTLLHRSAHVVRAQQTLQLLVADLVAEGVAAAEVRSDVPPRELALFCLHATAAATSTSSDAAVARIIEVTLTGIRPVA